MLNIELHKMVCIMSVRLYPYDGMQDVLGLCPCAFEFKGLALLNRLPLGQLLSRMLGCMVKGQSLFCFSYAPPKKRNWTQMGLLYRHPEILPFTYLKDSSLLLVSYIKPRIQWALNETVFFFVFPCTAFVSK